MPVERPPQERFRVCSPDHCHRIARLPVPKSPAPISLCPPPPSHPHHMSLSVFPIHHSPSLSWPPSSSQAEPIVSELLQALTQVKPYHTLMPPMLRLVVALSPSRKAAKEHLQELLRECQAKLQEFCRTRSIPGVELPKLGITATKFILLIGDLALLRDDTEAQRPMVKVHPASSPPPPPPPTPPSYILLHLHLPSLLPHHPLPPTTFPLLPQPSFLLLDSPHFAWRGP